VVYASLKPSNADVQNLSQVLSAQETAKAQRYVFDVHRRRYIVGRGLLRVFLGKLLDAPPSSFVFGEGPHGKPKLEAQPHRAMEFNVSHSEDEALYAFVYDRPVGVDVECIRPIDHIALAEHSFSPAERERLRSYPVEKYPEVFFSIWSRKEAFIKARGDGLSFPLHQFDVEVAPDQTPRLLANRLDPADVARWTMHALPEVNEAKTALCVEGEPEKLLAFRYEP
jgi:4'-phosphopantetheinyl transferase